MTPLLEISLTMLAAAKVLVDLLRQGQNAGQTQKQADRRSQRVHIAVVILAAYVPCSSAGLFD